ncbi:hypothetical protein GCM10023185_20580 [Hymenobacter saemangeumensis]|uniref:T9SS type A sorting domain-containing protein n=1 Tax=Hymenobacter saemangeumensis TaxID=1084522 RepID=A0ABP8IDL7_9BACT
MSTSFTSAPTLPSRTLRLLATLLTLVIGFSFTSAQAQNSGLFDNYVSINGTFYKTNAGNPPASAYAPLQGASLGSFDRNSGVLRLNGGRVNSFERNGDVVNAANIFYRVYETGTSPAGRGFQRLSLPLTNIYYDPVNMTNNKEFQSFNYTTNLVSLTQDPGTYTLEIYLQANASFSNGGGSGSFVLNDSNGGANYTATFTVTGTPQITTTWTGAINDNWFDPANWSNGVPSPTNDAVVPDFGPGFNIYPNIYSGSRVVNSQGVFQYDNTNSGPAECRTLLLQGTSQAARSICRLVTGTLRVNGDFYNIQDSFIQRENTLIVFSGGNTTISGGSQFVRMEIDGVPGSTKTLTGNVTIGVELLFTSSNLTTDINNPTTSYVELANRTIFNANNGAQINGETDQHYLRGFIRTTRNGVQANEGEYRTFGNMGMSLEFVGNNNPGDILVTRNTTESYNPLNDRFSIRRIFGVRPSDAQTNTGGLQANLIFRYLDSETQNLGPNGEFIPEQNLFLYVSTNSGNSFGQLGRDALDTNTNELTKFGVRTFATFTLGDRANPLPVSLTAFDARRTGADATITWDTALEKNSRGFDVQVSTNGRDFRTLGFVASATPNSERPQSYRYVDTTPDKAGIRYYRLRQLDLDGKETFFAPRSVNFAGKAKSDAKLAAYPNPFLGDLSLTMDVATAGAGQLRLMDITGRVISTQAVTLVAGTNEVKLDNLGGLKSGMYVARLTTPTGEETSVKVQKM